jgi:lipopolysaccharide export system permease protein
MFSKNSPLFSKIKDLFSFKKLDWYVLKEYVGPFLVTFFVAWFVLIMQFLWKYIDDLIGKGLSQKIIFKFMSYTSSTLIPMALPLAILLSSIMTMGKFGENSELTAAKSNGISLFRFFKSTIFFAIFVALFAFYYSNVIFTKTKAAADTMLGDIRNLKPALLIKPNTFYNGISGISIRIDSKNDQTGELFGIKIYNHNNGSGNESVMLAKRGSMTQSEDGKVLIMKLDSGIQYKDKASNSFDDIKYPFTIYKFAHYEKRFDLTQFQLTSFSNNPDQLRFTMNINQLNHHIDSLKNELKMKQYHFDTGFTSINTVLARSKSQIYNVHLHDSIFILALEDKTRMKLIRTNKIRNIKNSLFVHNSDRSYIRSLRQLSEVEWHRKFTLAISCIVLFFVGAPLGAIIKKGGIGLPMFIAVVLFIVYYAFTLFGSSLAEQNVISPVIGMWASTIVFLPFGIFLTFKAKNDSQIMNIEGYSNYFSQLYKKYVDKK